MSVSLATTGSNRRVLFPSLVLTFGSHSVSSRCIVPHILLRMLANQDSRTDCLTLQRHANYSGDAGHFRSGISILIIS